MSNEDTYIKLGDLTFEYERGPVALKNINLEVKPGELVAIMGPNGAGKTTLCYLLNGVIPNIFRGKFSGLISVLGVNPRENPIYVLAPKCGMVLQNPETQLIMPDIMSELAFGPENLGIPRDEIFRRIEWALKAVGMEGMEGRHPKEISGGQKQRVALAAGLTLMPELLILDEPTSQLDPIGTVEVINTIQSLREREKTTIIMTTHKTDEEAILADKVIILYNGQIVAQGPPHEVLTDINMLEKHDVKPPDVTKFCEELCRKIGYNKFKTESDIRLPITLDEAYTFISKLMKEKVIRVKKRTKRLLKSRKKDTEKPILEVKNLTFTYPGPPPVTALRNVSVNFYSGEFVAIIGQNGSGKTTLVKMLVGLPKPPKNTVFYKQRDAADLSIGEITKNISLVLQNPDHQLFTISAEKEIEWGLRNIGLPEEEIKKRVDKALKAVGLEKERDTFPLRLSFGDRRKLAAATAIAMEPEVLILDEPTTAQDYRGRYQLADIAKEMNLNGCTVIMITHDMDLVAKYAERTIVLFNGEVLLDGPTAEVFAQSEILKRTYINPPHITRLTQKLGEYGVPPDVLSVEELIDMFEVKGVK